METLGTLILHFLTSVCSKGEAFKNHLQKSHQTGQFVIPYACGVGVRSYHGWDFLGLLQKQREMVRVRVGIMQPQLDAQPR